MVIFSPDLLETLLAEIKSFDDLVKKHNFNKYETIFIGDSNHEIEEGKSARVFTEAVT